MSNPDNPSITLRLELEYDFVNLTPVAVNSTVVASASGEVVIDCLFVDPFTIHQKMNSSKKKEKGFTGDKNQSLTVKALPLTRLIISPSSAVVLMKQIQSTLKQLDFPLDDLVDENNLEEEND
jgi:hypothetical protein